jgi:DNA-binding GntR family transcriptional regulator
MQPGTAGPELQRLKAGPLRSQVFDLLRDAIIAGKYAPGEPLREISLARDLGVSQNTVREALLQLEQTGLVVRTPNKNTTITRLSSSDIAERVSTRMALEPLVCIGASERMTDADFADLQGYLDRIADRIHANNPFETSQADLAFHRRIWELSGRRFLYQILDQTTLPLFAFVALLRYRRPQSLAEVVLPHEEIFNALRSGDKAEITRVIREHLLRSYRDFVDPGDLLVGDLNG